MSSLTRDYEAILVAHPESAEGKVEKLKAQFGELVERHKGRVLDSADLGKRRLNYKMKKVSEGVYLQVRFQIPPSEVVGLQKASSSMESVLRFFVVKGSAPLAEARDG